MQAATISSHGGLDNILVREMPTPECPPDHVRVKVLAAALNHLDLFVCRGWPALQLNFPHILGSDACGEVIEIGAKAKKIRNLGYQLGDRAVVRNSISCGECEFCQAKEGALCIKLSLIGENLPGTYADFVAAPARQFHPAPKHLNVNEAAALTLTYLTAWRMLKTQAQINKNELLLIIGVGSGVSIACLHLATHMGCKVIVTSRSQEKINRALGYGAIKGFITNESLAREVRAFTHKRGVDVVIESVGAATWQQSLQCLRRGGRLVTCGATSGPLAQTDLNRLFWNQLKIFGSTTGNESECIAMLKFVGKHKIKPVIDRVFPLAHARDALAYLASGNQLGKIVLQVAKPA